DCRSPTLSRKLAFTGPASSRTVIPFAPDAAPPGHCVAPRPQRDRLPVAWRTAMHSVPAADPARTGTPLRIRTRQEIEEEIRRRVAAERERLLALYADRSDEVRHFGRPVERPFTAAERDRVTILIGGLTVKHDTLLKAAFESAGYRVEVMPVPDVAAFQLGKEYGNNGQCNPTYFMVGHLIKFLQELEARGMSR